MILGGCGTICGVVVRVLIGLMSFLMRFLGDIPDSAEADFAAAVKVLAGNGVKPPPIWSGQAAEIHHFRVAGD